MTVRYRSVLVVFILLLFLPFLPNGAGRITADAGSIENLKDAWFFYDPNAGEGMKKKKAEKLLTYLKAVSSDESIAIPGTIYCELDDDSEKTYILIFL